MLGNARQLSLMNRWTLNWFSQGKEEHGGATAPPSSHPVKEEEEMEAEDEGEGEGEGERGGEGSEEEEEEEGEDWTEESKVWEKQKSRKRSPPPLIKHSPSPISGYMYSASIYTAHSTTYWHSVHINMFVQI